MLTEYEKNIWELDCRLNQRGIPIDVDRVNKMQQWYKEESSYLLDHCTQITGGIVPTQRDKMLEWLQQYIPIQDLTAESVSQWVEKPINPKALEVLNIRQSIGKASVRKLKTIEASLVNDRLFEMFRFFGAHTGRWSGNLIQPQNFVRPDESFDTVENMFEVLDTSGTDAARLLYGPVIPVLANLMRSIICASPGKIFIDGDFSQIESRLLMWLADEEEGLQDYRDGVDLYSKMAESIFGYEVKNPSAERQLGKQVMLGCGFAIGWKNFQRTCKGYGLIIKEDLAKKSVDIFRYKYRKIKQLWRAVSDAACLAVLENKRYQVNGIQFYIRNNFLIIRLPSGRELSYPEPITKPAKYGLSLEYKKLKGTKWDYISTHGGLLVENIIQAIAFDLIVNCMIGLEVHGYSPVMTIHDQVISEMNENASLSMLETKQIMTQKPNWLPDDFPLEAEVKFTKRYGK